MYQYLRSENGFLLSTPEVEGRLRHETILTHSHLLDGIYEPEVNVDTICIDSEGTALRDEKRRS